MKFTKWQGLGNDFIIPDEINFTHNDIKGFAQKVCDRNFGIGADGLCLLETSDQADFRMRLINSDGSEAEMCGNLIRCAAKHMYETGRVDKLDMTVETLAGLMKPRLLVEDGKVAKVRVDMGEPKLKRGQIPMLGDAESAAQAELDAGGQKFSGHGVSMGNPHFVIYVDSISAIDLLQVGPLLEKHEIFPAKANIEFAEALDAKKVRMRVWERGAGVTLACGTGSCATVVAGVLGGKTGREAEVVLDGGSLFIEWSEENNHVYMTGPAVKVFAGELLV